MTMQEWEALTGQLVTDVRTETPEMKDTLPKWIDEERATSVQLLKVCVLRCCFCNIYALLHIINFTCSNYYLF